MKNKKVLWALLALLFLLIASAIFNDRVATVFSRSFGKKGPSVVKILRSNKGYQMTVDGSPYLIRGACYQPIPVGKGGDYNFWADTNKPWLTDGKLIQSMGANTVRFYRPGKRPAEVRKVLDDLYYGNGIRTILGTYLGFWGWPPPNYADPECTVKVKEEFLDMVKAYKDHPGILLWVIGNENNYSFDRNVQRWTTDEIDALSTEEEQRIARARIYYSLVNEIAKEVKAIDPNHPVALGVGEVKSLDIAKQVCPDVDVIGMIAYRGPGFGNLFQQVKQKFDLPIVMIEWGCDSYNVKTREPDEEAQAEFLRLQWADIASNADPKHGVGNCLGGTVFEWTDEWWKANENLPNTWHAHDTDGHWQNTSYHFDSYGQEKMNMNEEWWGLCSLNPKRKVRGSDERVTKKSYEALKAEWMKR